ncbi:MAG: diguanylate cyclase domain-containing protein [Acidimicrobiales bacterium]
MGERLEDGAQVDESTRDGREGARVALGRRQALEVELARQQTAGCPVGIIIVEVGHLSLVNLCHGWDVGNRYIEALADRLGDLVEDGALYHLHGNEFAVFVSGEEAARIHDWVDRITEGMSTPIFVDGLELDTDALVTPFTGEGRTHPGSDLWHIAALSHQAQRTRQVQHLIRSTFAGVDTLEALADQVVNAAVERYRPRGLEVRLGSVRRLVGDTVGSPLRSLALPNFDGHLAWWGSTSAEEHLSEGVASMIAEELALAAERVDNANLAVRDPLTGLLNRRGLTAHRQGAVDAYAVVMVDIDDMKVINDGLGHRAGDEALVALAELLSGRTGDLVARWGGEEFLRLLPGADLAAGVARAERLLDEASRTLVVGARPFTFSAGVAAGRSADPFHEVLEAADEALYRAKRSGKARVEAAPLPAEGNGQQQV